MKKLRAGLLTTALVALQTVVLVVSAAPASAYAPPISPDAPSRVTSPPPVSLKPSTTPTIPKTALGRIPGVGLAALFDEFVTPWLQGITGNSANPSLGCVGADGKFYSAGQESACAAAGPGSKPETKAPGELVVPDLLWGALTGKNLNPLLTGEVPANTSVAQLTPVFGAPANGLPNYVSVSWTGKQGSYCGPNPTHFTCPTGWESHVVNDIYTRAPMYAQCKTASGGLTGIANGGSNLSQTQGLAINNYTVSPVDIRVCQENQVPQYTKIKASWPPNNWTASIAPGVWVNPTKDLWQDTTVTSKMTCKNQAGSTVTVSGTTTGTGYVKQLQCPTGYLPDSGSTSVGNAFLDAPEKLEEWAITPQVRETYPDCIGWQAAGCVMRVELDGVDCSPANPACYDWAEIQRLQPSRVKCKWGNYTIDMSNCMALRNAYQSESGISAVPSQAPGAAPLGRDVFGRPLQPNADPAAPPNWQPDYGTPTNPLPGPGSNPNPNPGPVPIPILPPGTSPNPSPIPTTPDSSDSGCWPGGSAAFNPLEWVLQPVKCALNWAFVPKQATAQAQLTRIQSSVGKVPVVASISTVTTTIDTVGAAAGNGSGCTGPTFNFDFDQVHQEVQPFNACAEPVATMALVSRSLSTVVVIVLGVLAAARAFGASMGFNFTLGKSS